MGFILYNSNDSFDPTAFGMKVGDMITVVCVAGGQGGAGVAAAGAGGSSTFGGFVSASGTQYPGGFSASDGNYGAGGGGAGGYIPGVTITGGKGGDAIVFNNSVNTSQRYQMIYPQGTAGSGSFYIWQTLPSVIDFIGLSSPYATLPTSTYIIGSNTLYGIGGTGLNSGGGAGGGAGGGSGGSGYGAGGGGGGNAVNNGYKGGDSGKIVIKNISLPNLLPITVTAGVGGIGGRNTSNAAGGTGGTPGAKGSSGGDGGGGAGGCVVVFW